MTEQYNISYDVIVAKPAGLVKETVLYYWL